MNTSDNITIENIKDKLQSILNRSFKEPYRRKMDIYHDRINCCCPLCGDSRTDIRKKRGNIYLDTLHYHCYNCGEHMGINSFLHHFGEKLSSEDQIVVHKIQQNSKKFEKRVSATQGSMSMNLLDKLAVPKMILFKQLGIVSPYKNETASKYLKSRMIDIRDWKYFAYDPKEEDLYILNITPSDRVIGYQTRCLNPKSHKDRYLSRRLTRIYADVFKRDINGITERLLLKEPLGQKYIDEEDGIENIVFHLDRLSGIFNIMNVNMNKTVTIFEGPIDSLSIENSIALQGASKQLDGFFDEIENIRYMYDNDKTGKENSLKKLKSHKPVFLWEQYFQILGQKADVKDANDLQKMNLFKRDIVEKCFSDDEMDVIYI